MGVKSHEYGSRLPRAPRGRGRGRGGHPSSFYHQIACQRLPQKQLITSRAQLLALQAPLDDLFWNTKSHLYIRYDPLILRYPDHTCVDRVQSIAS
jgi:hypothetical protein